MQIEPGWIKGNGLSATLKMGGFWTNKTPDKFHLEVVYEGVVSIQGLKIGIDGEVTEFQPTVTLTSHDYIPGVHNSVASIPGHSESSRRFVMPLEYVRRMTEGKSVIIQVSLGSEYVEGTFSFNQPNFAKPAFVKMLAKVRG
jgi:hypothetical protein